MVGFIVAKNNDTHENDSNHCCPSSSKIIEILQNLFQMVEEEVPLDTAWKEFDLSKNIEYWIHPDQEKYLSMNIKMVNLANWRLLRIVELLIKLSAPYIL